MKIIADTHCHTLASSHAYSTVSEIINIAAQRGLYAIALTDHGKAMPNSPGRWYFTNLSCIPNVVNSVRVIKGIELNIIDYDGNVDDDPKETGDLEWIIAAMHDYPLPEPGDIEKCTNAWLGVAENPRINVIGHCGVERFKFDYERVIKEFGRYGKLVEINNNSFNIRQDSIENCKAIATLCAKHNVRIVVNSDAHFYTQVGDISYALDMLKSIDFPEKLIVNSNVDRFKAYLKERGIQC